MIFKGLLEHKKTKHSTMKYKTVEIMKLTNDKAVQISENRNDIIEKNDTGKIFAKKEIYYPNKLFYNKIRNSERNQTLFDYNWISFLIFLSCFVI
jgi:hypothetical protein